MEVSQVIRMAGRFPAVDEFEIYGDGTDRTRGNLKNPGDGTDRTDRTRGNLQNPDVLFFCHF